jgi:hypothetical protein
MSVVDIMHAAALNQGDQGENLIPPSLILIPDIRVPDIADHDIAGGYPGPGPQWAPSE